MLPVEKLTGLVLRQIIGGTAEEVAQVIGRHWTDHSQTLPRALARAHERAWQALGIALAGEGFVDQVRLFFSSGDDKGLREQIRIFLENSPLPQAMTAAQFRRACLEELKRLRVSGQVTTSALSADQVVREAKSFQRYTDSRGLIEGANQVVAHFARALSPDYPNLARLLGTPTPSGPALLPSAFAYFFRREVETNQELAQGLVFTGLENLLASQTQGFSEIHQVLEMLGNQLDQVFDQLGRIEAEIVETQTIAAATHGAVLDLQGEMQRLGNTNLAGFREVRELLMEVANRLARAGMPHGEVKLQHSLSIRNEDERLAIKALLVRFRQLPTENQKEMPALLNGLGKLQIGTGDFAGARQTFEEVAHAVGEASAQAEAWFNAYLAALEKKNWEEALQAIHWATALDPARFAPFPVQRYQPKRILGAGGFGTAFLCYDRNFDEEVVVKTLYGADMERNMAEVFQEARVLRRLSHPAIIGVHECEFADPGQSLRPYIVMDYFPGISLDSPWFLPHGKPPQ